MIHYITKREKIYSKYDGRCAYCGELLKKGWHIDHIKPVLRGYNNYLNPENDTIENSNPACPSCNIQKKDFTIEQFRHNIKRFVVSLNKYSTQYKFAKKYGLITENDIEVKFYFETYESTKH